MKTTIIAGLSLALAGIGISFYRNRQLQQSWKPPSREEVVKLLVQLRQAMYPCLMEVTQVVQTQLKALNLQITPPQMMQELKLLILSEQCPTGIKIQRIMAQFHEIISQHDLEKATQQLYKDDPQIRYHKKAFQEQFQKSFLGIAPDLKTDMPVFIRQQTILEIVEGLLADKIERLKKEFQEKGSLSEDFLERDAKVDLQFRKKELNKLGLKETKNPVSIFEFCTAKYLKMDGEFKQKYEKLVSNYKKDLSKYTPLQ